MRKTIFFDLDGTLTDSAPGIMNSVAFALEKMGHPPLPEATLRRFVGPPLTDEFRETCGWDEEKALSAITHFRTYFTQKGIWENAPYPGVKEMLSDLRDAGCSLRVATSKPEVFALRILERFGLLPFFDRVDGASLNETRSADKGTVLRKAAAAASFTDRAVMVGDRKYDVAAGRSAGFFTVAVLYGYGSREELSEAGPDAMAETVAACRELLLSL